MIPARGENPHAYTYILCKKEVSIMGEDDIRYVSEEEEAEAFEQTSLALTLMHLVRISVLAATIIVIAFFATTKWIDARDQRDARYWIEGVETYTLVAKDFDILPPAWKFMLKDADGNVSEVEPSWQSYRVFSEGDSVGIVNVNGRKIALRGESTSSKKNDDSKGFSINWNFSVERH